MTDPASPPTQGLLSRISFREVQPRRAYEEVVRQLQEAIVRGDLAPGNRLPSERELMTVFRVSRATVREALRVLERTGLITVRPGLGGAVVAEFSLASVEAPLELLLQLNQVTPAEMVEFRHAMETAAARWAAIRADEADLNRMRAAIRCSEESRGDWDRWHSADLQFHTALADASKNSVNRIVMKVLRGVLYGEISSAFRELPDERRGAEEVSMLADHRAILQAIERRDPDGATHAMRAHVERFSGMFVRSRS